MKERPILFSTPMVRAIFDGRKTQTRRVIKLGLPPDEYEMPTKCEFYNPTVVRRGEEVAGPEVYGVSDEDHGWPCPYGAPTHQLWVRETWLPRAQGTMALYRADMNDFDAAGISGLYGGWKPSIFMPRWACRLILEIKNVRVERLHDISERDAKAEGIEKLHRPEFNDFWWKNYGPTCRINNDPTERELHYFEPIGSYRTLWDSINTKRGYAWATNPWVWVIEFQPVKEVLRKAIGG